MPIDTINNKQDHREQYEQLLALTQVIFEESKKLVTATERVFYKTTNQRMLFDAFLSGIPEKHRSHYTCNTCKSFFNRYGGLVYIETESWVLKSALWDIDRTPVFFKQAIRNIINHISYQQIQMKFVIDDGNPTIEQTDWGWIGTRDAGGFHHFAVPISDLRVQTIHTSMTLLADVVLLKNNVKSFHGPDAMSILSIAETILRSESNKNKYIKRQLAFVEKFIGICNIIHLLSNNKLQGNHRFRKNNASWYYTEVGGPGVYNIMNTVAGSVIQDVKDGLTTPDIVSRLHTKMGPLKYMRPTAPPKGGAIDNAEKIFAELGIADSLKRKFATIDEIPLAWKPSEKEAPTSGGLFDHLRETKSSIRANPVPEKIIWEKFKETVLPTATKIEYYVSHGNYFGAIASAVVPNSKPIFIYDSPENRNQLSIFGVYNTTDSDWNLQAGTYVDVLGIFYPGMGMVDVMFILKGCKIKNYTNQLAIFPSNLIPELFSIRSVIEAFSRRGILENADNQLAGVGLNIREFDKQPLIFRVNETKSYTVYF